MGGEAMIGVAVHRLKLASILLLLCSCPPAFSQEADTSSATTGAAPAAPSAADAADAEPEPVPLRQRPYDVLVSVGFHGDSQLALLDESQVLQGLADAVQRMYGPMWQADIERNTWLVPGTAARLQRLQESDILPAEGAADSSDPDSAEAAAADEAADADRAVQNSAAVARYPEKEVDKVFLVTVEVIRNRCLVSCREYDTKSQELTPIRSEVVHDPRALPAVAVRLIRDSFRPTLMFHRRFQDSAGNDLIQLEVQAGEFPAPDPSAKQVVVDDVLRPFLRQMERRDPTQLRQLQPLPLTYIRVTAVDDEIARGMVTGVLISHTDLVPFGGRARRTEQMALRQRPAADSSRVKLVLRTRPDKPLVSQRTSLAYKLRWKDEDQAEQQRLLSDRNGELEISRHPDFPTFWIYVYSGGILLARVPYAPGMLPYDVVELPDDSVRLGLEGELQLLQDELVDAVALREVWFSMARKAAEDGDADAVREHLQAYADVPGRDYFLEQLSLRRVPAVNEARARGNRSQERFVTRLAENMRDSITEFFSDDKRLERLTEIQKLRDQVGL